MTNTSAATADVSAETRTTLLSYLDALALAEPIQAKLWQLAEITLTQVQVLRALRDGPQTLGRLGQSIGLSPTSVTRVVDRLEPAGERLMGEIRVIRGSDIHLAVEAMTSQERRQLTASLRRLVELARAASAQTEQRE